MYSSQTLVSDGTVQRVDLSIEFLVREDIRVFVDDALLPANGYSWTWVSATAITLNQPVHNRGVINIRRVTAYDTIKHIFEVGGAVFKDRNVDENFRQVLYWCQDFIEGKSFTDVWNDLNMHGYRILNLGAAVDPHDAVPLGQYQADALGAWQASRVAQTLNAESMDKLNTVEGYSTAMREVLESNDTNLEVAFPDGSRIPTVAKRTVALTSAVSSVNGKIGNVVVGETYIDIRTFGVIVPATVEDAKALTTAEAAALNTAVYDAIAQLPRGSTLYIPPNCKWNNLQGVVYPAMPEYCKIIDDSGYDARYGGIWQSATVEWYKTSDSATTTGGTNGNTHTIRGNYHPAWVIDNDAPAYTGGARSSIVYRFTGSEDMAQFSADRTKQGSESIGVRTYGTLASGGATAFHIGLQSSNTPNAVAFNTGFSTGTSFSFGKALKPPAQTEEQWKASTHTTRYVQPAEHTGAFTKMWYLGTNLTYRQDIQQDGTIICTNKDGRVYRITAGGAQYGLYKHVVKPPVNSTINAGTSAAHYSNVAAVDALTLTLPKAVEGMTFTVSQDTTQVVTLKTNAADVFVGLTTKMLSGAVGSTVTVTAITPTIWSFSRTGTWTDS